jgi:hypothetical protein
MPKTAKIVKVSFPLKYFRLQLIKQGGHFIVYSHRFDIATTGKSEAQAMGNFTDLASIFTEDVIKTEAKYPGTYKQSLLDRGWTNRAKRWNPPVAKVAKSA